MRWCVLFAGGKCDERGGRRGGDQGRGPEEEGCRLLRAVPSGRTADTTRVQNTRQTPDWLQLHSRQTLALSTALSLVRYVPRFTSLFDIFLFSLFRYSFSQF